MLRDDLAGLIEPMVTAREFIRSVVITKRDKPGVLQVHRVGDLSL